MPDWNTVVRQRLARLRMTGEAESALAEELAQHLEERYSELTSGGVEPEEAFRQAAAELEDVRPLGRDVNARRRLPTHDPVPAGDGVVGSLAGGLWRDLRYALRGVRRSPLFVVLVAVILSLGIGANTIVFTVLETLLLDPLPVRQAAQLAAVSSADKTKTGAPLPISYADLEDYAGRNQVFESLAGYVSPRGVTWRDGGATQGMFAEFVTGNYFSTLGLRPAAGRFFLPEEDGAPGAHAVAVMSYGTWSTRFGASPEVVGRRLRINDVVFTVVGVAPAGFMGMNAVFGPDLWIPAAMAERVQPHELRGALSDRAKAVFLGVGRLKPGVPREQAQANLAAIAAALAREYPVDGQRRTAAVRPVREVLFASSFGAASPIVFAGLALLAVAGMVLLIACSNVANLLLARGAGRRHEIAVRLAMGASRTRLARQLLTESLLLGLLGGAGGVLLGYGGLRLLFSALPASGNFVRPHVDGTVLGFALAISAATGLLFGALPAWQASRAEVGEELKQGGRMVGHTRRRVSTAHALLAGQVAFSFLLLLTAALFLRSIGQAYAIDPGFQTAHLAVFTTNPGQAGYAHPEAFYREVRRRVAALPGIESVSWASNMPLWAAAVEGLQIEGRQERSRSDTLRTVVNTVDRGYFETAGVALEEGREFSDADRANSTPVAIVNQALERRFGAGGALGRRVQLPGEKQMRVVVGVARTANYSSWGEPPQLCVYVPLAQSEPASMVLYVRSRRDPGEVLLPVEREIHATAPAVLVSMRTGRQIIDGGLFQARMGVGLLSIFGLLALGLASVGLYGILAYSVSRRRREIGLRMALGATPGEVVGLIVREGMALVAAGVLIGWMAELLVGRLLSRMLYGVGASDPFSVAGAAALLGAVALLACYLPARGAMRVDPLAALHEG